MLLEIEYELLALIQDYFKDRISLMRVTNSYYIYNSDNEVLDT